MNYSRISIFLGFLVILFGATMSFALPWTFPILGQTETFDRHGFFALLNSMVVCGILGGFLLFLGRKAPLLKSRWNAIRGFFHFKKSQEQDNNDSYNPDNLYNDEYINTQNTNTSLLRREAIAIVGLSWLLAGILGALPFMFAHIVRDVTPSGRVYAAPVDCLFESFSGVTGLGASILSNVEESKFIPKAIQFWRCELHFLGGLGIMVLFVAILGGHSAGKSLMLTEMPHTPNESPFSRAQKTAFALLSVYLILNTVLIILLWVEGMSIYDAVCHSFSAVATGGFSTKKLSVGAFNSPLIELTLMVFMFISSCNYIWLFCVGTTLFSLRFEKTDITENRYSDKKSDIFKLFKNTEFLVFTSIVVIAILLVSVACWIHGDCIVPGTPKIMTFQSLCDSFRYGSFQVMSIISSTGFGTANFDDWNDFSRGILFALMFTGACVGSTTCGLKMMRLIVLWKTLGIEIERIFRPNVVRAIYLQGKPVEDTDEIRHSVLSYFALYCVVFAGACLLLLTIEPTSTWTNEKLDKNQKMYDCITAVATTYNCVGPSFGITGVRHNFGAFHAPAKYLFILLMLLGRLELYVVIAMFCPRFWRN